ncbi:MAG: SUMF1/EgtB/PvdO family nonheme iron enzyme [Kiritimatiellia bacterium]|jgi:formylglycine-generating enzyme required for sulfatase activity|nr:SUMF1/EgtB/PvdO family nonheme iron enzyme [Kiritimatiellia bacterium]
MKTFSNPLVIFSMAVCLAGTGSAQQILTTVRNVTVSAPVITWSTQPDGVYSLLAADAAEGPFDTVLVASTQTVENSISYTDRRWAPEGTHRYYQVVESARGYATYMIVDLSGGPEAEAYPVSYTNDVPDLLADETYKTNKMVFRLIPGGTNITGFPADAPLQFTPYIPLGTMTLTRPHYMGVFEVTQDQYALVMNTNPSPSYRLGPTRPVQDVTYNDLRGSAAQGGGGWPTNSGVYADSFMGRLRQKTGYGEFDLPTAGQFEFAARAGTTALFYNGFNGPTNTTDFTGITNIARCKGNQTSTWGGYAYATSVGSYLPNAWGLYDMTGNLSEHCLDWGGSNSGIDPVGPVSGAGRTVRGGAHSTSALSTLYIGARDAMNPSLVTQSGVFGFRTALRLPGSPAEAMRSQVPAGTIISVTGTPCSVPQITWRTVPGKTYIVLYATSETGPFETQLGDTLTASGDTLSVTDTGYTPGGPQRYYRAEELPGGYARYLIVDISGGTNAPSWPVTYTNVLPDINSDLYRTTRIAFRLIPPGSFIMGAPLSTVGATTKTTPHKVTLTRPFYMAVFETTEAQHSLLYKEGTATSVYPVGSVTYNMLRGSAGDWPLSSNVAPESVTGLLRAKTGGALDFDLPTEAQWEYACRAGTTSAFNNGDDLKTPTDFGTMQTTIGLKNRHVGGTYQPNSWSLYDMHGNVMEWVLDRWTNDLGTADATDPVGPASTTTYSCRGSAYLATDSFKYASFSRENGGMSRTGATSLLSYRLACRLD